jgi:hypothetical protein
MGFYAREGLNVSLQKTAGWAVVRDKVQNKEYDASHMLSPMPLAMSLGLGSARQIRRGDDPEHQRPGHHAAPEAQGQDESRRTGRG